MVDLNPQCILTAAGDPPAASPPTRQAALGGRAIRFWFAMLMLTALAARLIDPVGWLGSDDASYHAAAEYLLQGEPIHRVHHHYARSPIIASVAIAMWLFGDSPAALAAPALLSSMVCIVLVVLIGRRLWGWRVGLLAGTIMAFLPAFQNASTAALPGAFTCCFAAAAILATVLAADATRRPAYWSLAVTAGVLAGMATSVKLFTGAVVVGIFLLAWQTHASARRRQLGWMALVLAGAALFVLLECIFYAWTAGNFWFKFEALDGTRGASALLPGQHEAYSSLSQTLRLVFARLTMPWRLVDSGWGTIGYAFWPAILVAGLWERRARSLALWAAVTFLGVAFVPISIVGGVYLFPTVGFNGINLIAIGVPLSLCLAWAAHRLATRTLESATLQRFWPVALIAVAVISNVDRYRINARGQFLQQQIGLAIEQMVAKVDFAPELPIFTTPSLYWRYRVLFPRQLRKRLRVSAQADAPDWWHDVSVDIHARLGPIPPPNQAYLLAAPEHLRGEVLYWDYGVGIPKRDLTRWKTAQPVATAVRNKGIITIDQEPNSLAPGSILCLLGPARGEAKLASSHAQRAERESRGG